MIKIEGSKKALIAMSGGVDSSVAALLMQKDGYECVGTTLKLYHNEDIGVSRQKTCCSLDDVEDARLVAKRLGIKYYVFNFSDCFRETVMKKFASSYLKGFTPNPCIDCNKYLKFGKLIQRMEELQMDYVVTGHYARIAYDKETGRYLLKKGVDSNKDQSYVLYMLTQDQLAHIKFPLGELTKEEVRRIAEENGFVNAQKHDSQDICFVPDGDYAKVVKMISGSESRAGKFVTKDGDVLGLHKGVVNYTIGQRRGLGISSENRLYVTDIDVSNNNVILGDESDLYSSELVADNVNLILFDRMTGKIRVEAKVRYRQSPEPAEAWMDEKNELHVKFDRPQRAITKGQAVVLYKNDIVVGGGEIKSVIN